MKTKLSFFIALVMFNLQLWSQCGSLSFDNQSTDNGFLTVDVIYTDPPSDVIALTMRIEFSNTDFALNVTESNANRPNNNFTVSADPDYQKVDIDKTSGGTLNLGSGNVTIATIYFSIPAGESTDITFDNLSVIRGTPPNCNLASTSVSNTTGYTASSVTISGFMEKQTEGSDLPDVLVDADAALSVFNDDERYSPTSGTFSISLLPGDDYTLSFSKTGLLDCDGGVNATDVNELQKHLLTTEPFTLAYEHVASDVNGSGTISNQDIIKMQKIINGTAGGDGDIVSWTFMPQSEYNNLTLPSSPSGVPSYDEEVSFTNLTSNQSNVVIYGVKLGDITSSGCMDLTGKSLDNEREKRQISLPKLQARSGEEFLIPVRIIDFRDQLTLGLNLQFNPDFIELLDIENGSLPELGKNDYSITHDTRGMLTLIWFTMQKEGLSSANDQPLFFIKARALRDIKDLEPLVRLSYQRLENRMFAANGETFDLELTFSDLEAGKNFPKDRQENRKYERTNLYPNPFSNILTLELQASKNEEATIKLMTASGKILRILQREVSPGFNRLNFEGLKELPEGYLFYEIVLSDQKLQGKVLKQ